MKSYKKIFSVLLVTVMLLSVVFAAPITVSALDGHGWYPVSHTSWNYSLWNYYDNDKTNTVGITNYGAIPETQSVTSLKNDGYLIREAAPYIAYVVIAPAEGDYTINPVYQVGTTSGTVTYNMVVGVNDTDYYVGKNVTATSGSGSAWVGEGQDMYTVHLNKGANIIRLLTLADDDYSKVTWVDPNCLFVQSGLTVLNANTATLTLNAADSSYVNNWEVKPEGRNILGNVGAKNSPMREAKLTFANVNQDNLSKLSYFAYTLNAPQEGYYDISMNFNIGNTAYAGTGYYIVRVNGKYYKRPFKYYGNGYEDANLSVYLEKGDNTVLISSAIDVSSYGVYGGYAGWCDVSTLTVNGGVTLSATQVNPLTIEDDVQPDVVIDAGTYGILNKYSVSTTEVGIKTGKPLVGGMQQDAANLQSLASMQTDGYFDKAPAPYVSYLVKAAAKSTYNLTVDYRPSVNSGYTNSDYYMVVSVNDSKYYKAYYSANPSNSNWSKSTIEVELDEGVNTVRCIAAVAETSAIISWLNMDCITISGKYQVAPVLPQVSHLQSGQASYKNGFNTVRTGTTPAWMLSYLADYRGNTITNAAGVNFDNLNSRNMSKLCYFAYTVDVPYDGYYDMQTYISTGANGTGYLILVVDGEKFKYNVRDTYKSVANNRNNISCYLTAGTHTIAVSGILNHSGYLSSYNGIPNWCDMGALTVSGGIVKAATQIDPLSYASATANRGLILSSAYSTDSKYVIGGVSVNTTVDFLKSNFLDSKSVTVTYDGAAMSNSDLVLSGAVVDYGDGYTYTVGSIFGDINGDAVTDIRDLKATKEFVFGDTTEIDATSANVIEDTVVNSSDVNEFRSTILGGGTVINYQPISYGPSALLNYANPIGRLVEYKNAVFMESSASNFTISGYMKGDVKVQLYVDNIKTDQYGIFIEIDGNDATPYYRQLSAATDMTVTVATGLSAGYHTIKISKSTDAKNDDIYVYSVTMNGTPMKTQGKKHKLEFVGDSITAAYGSYDGRTLSYYGYANFTADALDADYYSVANGGWRFTSGTNCITDIYDDVSMQQNLGAYDFSYKPDVVVINLGTNDGTGTNGAGCTTILQLVRAKNPNAKIVYAYGLMGTAYADNEATVKAKVEAFAKTDGNTYYCHLPANNGGVGQHPNVAGMQAASVVLANYIANLMGWESNPISSYGRIS